MTIQTFDENLSAASGAMDGFSGAAGDHLQFVVFHVGCEVFAADLAPVQEIIRVPEIVRVPLAPSALVGLANLRGKILPVVSLARMLGLREAARDDSMRAVVIELGHQSLGFVVDRVASILTVARHGIEDPGSIGASVNVELLAGLIRSDGERPLIMVLDFATLVAREFDAITRAARSAGVVSGSTDGSRPNEEAEVERQLVSFQLAAQEFAIGIEDVREIVRLPEQVIHVPHTESHVLGVMTLRAQLLPLVSMRSLFGLPRKESDDRSRIVVVSHGGESIGLVTDWVSEVLRVSTSSLEPMPGMLARGGRVADIPEICRLAGGRLVSIISPASLFSDRAIVEVLSNMENLAEATDTEESADNSSATEEQVVVFRLADGEFGVRIETVQEIVRVPDSLTRVPKAAAFVEGVINLRGSVLPVLDLRKRLHIAVSTIHDRERIIVFLVAGSRTGFIVDEVTEVLSIAIRDIETAPPLSSEHERLLSRVANLKAQQRIIQLIEPAHLVEGPELALLELARGAAAGADPESSVGEPSSAPGRARRRRRATKALEGEDNGVAQEPTDSQ